MAPHDTHDKRRRADAGNAGDGARERPSDSRRPDDAGKSPQRRFHEEVGHKAERKQRARAEDERTVFFWLGMFGLVGWAVAVPTVAGIALGVWLDRTWPAEQASWTLTFLLIGVLLGCLNAWYWVKRESGDD
ncbi:MAG: AtpZ/AtpI family protein [Thiohalocapsa sp.]|nr:AtpZ/AtpI family protein [Thiohalocapsa sp.]